MMLPLVSASGLTVAHTERATWPLVAAFVTAGQQEGPLTTFFTIDSARTVIDSWSHRIASFRTSDLVAVRCVDRLALTA